MAHQLLQVGFTLCATFLVWLGLAAVTFLFYYGWISSVDARDIRGFRLAPFALASALVLAVPALAQLVVSKYVSRGLDSKARRWMYALAAVLTVALTILAAYWLSFVNHCTFDVPFPLPVSFSC